MMSLRLTTQLLRKRVANINKQATKRTISLSTASEYILNSDGLKEHKKIEHAGPSDMPTYTMHSCHHTGVSIWDMFTPNDNDIFVVTPARSGTALVQEIVGQLLYNGDYYNKLNVTNYHATTPWLTYALVEYKDMLQMLENQLNQDSNVVRRCMRLHDPIETIKYNPKCKYIFIGRDYRDMVWSCYRLYCSFTDQLIDLVNSRNNSNIYDNVPHLPKLSELTENGTKTLTEYEFWKLMLSKNSGAMYCFDRNDSMNDIEMVDGYPLFSLLLIIGSWWNASQNLKLENVQFLHFNQFRTNLRQTIIDIGEFLEIDIDFDSKEFNKIVSNCSLESMKQRKSSPMHAQDILNKGLMTQKGSDSYFGKASKYSWENVLTKNDIQQYRLLAQRYMDDEAIYWMENGTFM